MTNDIFAAIAHEKREAAKTLRAKTIEYLVKSLSNLFRASQKHLSNGLTIETRIDSILSTWPGYGWSNQEITTIVFDATKKAFGDPLTLYKDPLQLKQFKLPYVNPTFSTLNVSAMGLPDEDGKIINTLPSGGIISIPATYTVGGRHSTVYGVAPQLQVLPQVGDRLLDLSPLSYAEWIMYHDYILSPCCEKQIMWSDNKSLLLCFGCKKAVCP